MSESREHVGNLILGSLLIDNDLLFMASRILEPSDFATTKQHGIFTAIQLLHLKEEPVDWITVTAELKAMGLLNQIPPEHLTSLVDNMPQALDEGGLFRLGMRLKNWPKGDI